MDQLSLLFNEAEVYTDKAAEADDGAVWPWQPASGAKRTNIPWIICLRMCLWR